MLAAKLEGPSQHRRRRATVFWTLGLILAVALLTWAASDAAAPRLVMVYGELLPTPVVLSDLEENARLMASVSTRVDQEPEDLDRRRYLNLAFFWGEAWDDAPSVDAIPADLAPAEANRQGRFYPATEDMPALVWLEAVPGQGGSLRWMASDGVAILKEHGVPVRVENPLLSAFSFTFLIAGFLWLAFLVLIILWLRRMRRPGGV